MDLIFCMTAVANIEVTQLLLKKNNLLQIKTNV